MAAAKNACCSNHTRCTLTPGYIAVSTKPALLCSVCTNGVIVTVWDRLIRIGGMAHCVYPAAGNEEYGLTYYADFAVPQLIRRMKENKCRHMVAQLFGGSNINGRLSRRARKLILTVRKVLKKWDINIVSEDIGGSLGRKIIFDTSSGDAVVFKTRDVRRTDWWIE